MAESDTTKTSDNPGDLHKEENEEGPHLKNLKHALKNGVDKCINSIKLDQFKQAYSFIDQKQPKLLEHVHAKYKSAVQDMMQQEIAQMLDEENLSELLQGMDKMKETCSASKAWRPSGVPSDDIEAHLIAIKLVQKEKLEKFVEQVEAQQKQQETLLRHHQKLFADKVENLQKVTKLCNEAAEQGDHVRNMIKSTDILDDPDVHDDSGFLSESLDVR